MKAIETRYAGRRFRSRLEARWAVLFDSLGIPWEYEPEAFHMTSGEYLPDFRLFGNAWLEVKPIGFDLLEHHPEHDRYREFALRAGGLVLASGDPDDRFSVMYTAGEDGALATWLVDWWMSARKGHLWVEDSPDDAVQFLPDDNIAFLACHEQALVRRFDGRPSFLHAVR